jgi:uncharacterized protein (TIGR02001 family)
MRKSLLGLSAVALVAVATPAVAQEEAAPAIKLTGNVSLVSDYRFRGFTQSGENAAIQGGFTATHESGFYAGTWGSSINFAGNTEIDLFAGYSTALGEGLSVDVGLLYYLYPKKGGGDTDYFEPYLTLTGTVGPATIKAGVNYSWSQSALGNNSAIYFRLDPSVAIPSTPFTLNGHIGYASSDSFLGGPTGDVFDYSVGVSATWKALTFGVAYVNTDVPNRIGAATPKETLGADGAVVFSLTAAF